MLKFILACTYFFLPAYFTNMVPSLLATAGWFEWLAKPVDFGKKIRNSPILGDHKTWRGNILGPLVGISIALFQGWLFKTYSVIREISFFNYQQVNLLMFGVIISLGTICGDNFFSFIKRRLKLKPGARFFPFDQTNYVIGSFIFLSLFSNIQIGINVWITLSIISILLHISSTQIGFALGLSKSKW